MNDKYDRCAKSLDAYIKVNIALILPIGILEAETFTRERLVDTLRSIPQFCFDVSMRKLDRGVVLFLQGRIIEN
jgi:hypothetical protein